MPADPDLAAAIVAHRRARTYVERVRALNAASDIVRRLDETETPEAVRDAIEQAEWHAAWRTRPRRERRR